MSSKKNEIDPFAKQLAEFIAAVLIVAVMSLIVIFIIKLIIFLLR